MIDCAQFYSLLKENNTDFFAGVPDSLLKNFCAYITDTIPESNHVITPNEGSAIALATGYHLATGKYPLVYMQNSGLGNTVNPLLSLASPEVYSIPMILLIGWRGEPGIHDEPQHISQGKLTLPLLDTMQIPYSILSDQQDRLAEQLQECYTYLEKNNAPYAIVIRKNTFQDYCLQNNKKVAASISREAAIEKILLSFSKTDIVVSTTGMISRELYELRNKHGMDHSKDFLTVGSMGHASQIALGIALQKKERKVVCIDGDGAAIMHMGGMATIGSFKPSNYVHIVLNNGAHDSVGGQPTIARTIDLCGIASADGYENVLRIKNLSELEDNLSKINIFEKLTFLEVYCKKGARKDLGRPTRTPIQNKEDFMEFLK